MKIVVSEAMFTQALALYGMEVYDHLTTEALLQECVWKMRTWYAQNIQGQIVVADAWSECENCGAIKDRLTLLDL